MPWYEVQLTSRQAAANEHGRIQDGFELLFQRLRTPRDMAMFSGQDAGEDNLRLYFSLGPSDLTEGFLRVVGARPSQRPPENVSLVVGHSDALQRLRAGSLP
jgi:hypothetical protein